MKRLYCITLIFSAVLLNGGVSLKAQTFTVTDNAFCNFMIAPEYKSGVDVRGNKVAGADFIPETSSDQNAIEIPDEIIFPLTVDLIEFAQLPDEFLEAEGVVGTIRVKGNDVYFNDTKIATDQLKALEEFCQDKSAAESDINVK